MEIFEGHFRSHPCLFLPGVYLYFMTDPFDEITARGAPPIQDLALQTRALIFEVYPAVVEVLWPRQAALTMS